MQAGLIYYDVNGNIVTPSNNKGLRLFRNSADDLYYVKNSAGVLELFSLGTNAARALFQDVTSVNNVGAGEDTLYSNSIDADTLAINGASISAKYVINYANTANAKVIRLYFGGTLIFQSTLDASLGGAFTLYVSVEIIRTGLNTARAVVSYTTNSDSETQYTDLAGQDFTIANILLLTGEGVANSDITAVFGKGMYLPNV